MYISRLVIRNFRNFRHVDVLIQPGTTCVLGENNAGKSNLVHALRLAIDTSLSHRHRQLVAHDFSSGVDFSRPTQVLIAVEFRDFVGHDDQEALVGPWQVENDVARLVYRFRPRPSIREAIEAAERVPEGLTLDDYQWELVGGGPGDPLTVSWDESLGQAIRYGHLQNFEVVYLHALRDVQQDLRQRRTSPLNLILSVSNISPEEQAEIVEVIQAANSTVEGTAALHQVAETIQTAFRSAVGETFGLDVRLGMSDPSFASVAEALQVLLTDGSFSDFDTSRNGLGLNNVLYVSMLLEYFRRRTTNPHRPGQVLLVEEPEAHLHPQLQRILYQTLAANPSQTILTTHSTHISSGAPLGSVLSVTRVANGGSQCASLAQGAALQPRDIADLERYLDATRSALLYAKKVLLVEGPAELFVIPALVRSVRNIDFDRLGIAVVPIYGTHFSSYAKLFGAGALPKKCAVVADGDQPVDEDEDEDDAFTPPDLEALNNDFVRVFQCTTTFERELTQPYTLEMLRRALVEAGCPRIAGACQDLLDWFPDPYPAPGADPAYWDELERVRGRVLSAASRVGKARFAQIVSKHSGAATGLPLYIHEAVEWLLV